MVVRLATLPSSRTPRGIFLHTQGHCRVIPDDTVFRTLVHSAYTRVRDRMSTSFVYDAVRAVRPLRQGTEQGATGRSRGPRSCPDCRPPSETGALAGGRRDPGRC